MTATGTIPPALRYLSDAELASLGITPPEVADALEALLRANAAGQASAPPKIGIHPGDERFFMVTLSHAQSPPYAVTKTVGLSPENAAHGLPYIGSVINVLDGRTGMPLAVMDGAWITAVRTAALSAVAARHLARADSRSVLFVGCGVQARSHLDALTAEFPVDRVLANSRTRASADRFCDEVRARGLRAEVAESPNEVLPDVDMVVSSVNFDDSLEPFLDASRLAAGAFAALVDVARPWLPASLETLDVVVVDDVAQERIIGPAMNLDAVAGDLGTLVTGATRRRVGESERCALVSRGLGLGDLALSALAYERARDAGAGIELARA